MPLTDPHYAPTRVAMSCCLTFAPDLQARGTWHRVGELLPILGQLEPCRLVVVSRGLERFQA